MKHATPVLVLLIVAGPACVSFELDETEDPRLGDLGRVRFVGGGCNNSTTLATGSTVTLTLEPQAETLPNDLSIVSTEPTIIEASPGDSIDRVVLHARDSGESYIELQSMGDLYDGLAFFAEPADEVLYEGPEAVFVGGTMLLKISEVHCSGGDDCQLIGWGFIDWSRSAGSFEVMEEREGWSSFLVAGAPHDVVLTGVEPTRGALLVEHPVTILHPSEAEALEVEVQMMLPDEVIVEPQPLPTDVPRGSLFQLLLHATTTGGRHRVALPSADHQLTIVDGEDCVEPAENEPNIEGQVFVARELGEASWIVEVPLFGWRETVTLSITD